MNRMNIRKQSRKYRRCLSILLAGAISGAVLAPAAAYGVAVEMTETETVPEIACTTVPSEENFLPLESVSIEPSSEETLPEETLWEETLPEETLLEETSPEETLPEGTLPEETLPEETLPEETSSEETLPEETSPDETSAAELAPTEALPVEALPGETLPVQILPGQTLPAETTAPTLVVKQPPLDLEAMRAAMPAGQPEIRTQLALKAYSLVGQVGYFWGGKSASLGWDGRWDEVMMVSAEGSPSTGTFRSFGLDCSGFVGWVYVNAFQDTSVLHSLGCLTSEQWENSYEVAWEDAVVGDLVFLGYPSELEVNHVGMIVDRDKNGHVKIAHCSSSSNNVVVEDGQAGFRFVRRPYLMKDVCACTTQAEHRLIHDPECSKYTGWNTDPQARDPLVWDSVEQLTVDLRSLFPDASLAEAVGLAIWDTYSEPVAGHNVPDAELYRCFRLQTQGAARLVDFVLNAEISVSWVGESEEQREACERQTEILQARKDAGEDVELPEYDRKVPVTSLEGIQYLRSAHEIDLSYNEITSLAPVDGQRINALGSKLYHWSVYYLEDGVWKEDASGTLHEEDGFCPYFGGGLPGAEESYATFLNLKGNPIQEVPQELPGRLLICNIKTE